MVRSTKYNLGLHSSDTLDGATGLGVTHHPRHHGIGNASLKSCLFVEYHTSHPLKKRKKKTQKTWLN